MIQRIQSIYLLIAAILMAVVAFSPIVVLQEGRTLFSCGIKEGTDMVFPTWGILTMAGLSSLLSLITIFLFKNRKKQRSFILISALTIVLYYVTTVVYLTSYMGGDFPLFSSVAYGIFLPIIAMIFLFLADWGVRKDEKLVKSLNRIR